MLMIAWTINFVVCSSVLRSVYRAYVILIYASIYNSCLFLLIVGMRAFFKPDFLASCPFCPHIFWSSENKLRLIDCLTAVSVISSGEWRDTWSYTSTKRPALDDVPFSNIWWYPWISWKSEAPRYCPSYMLSKGVLASRHFSLSSVSTDAPVSMAAGTASSAFYIVHVYRNGLVEFKSMYSTGLQYARCELHFSMPAGSSTMSLGLLPSIHVAPYLA